MGVWQFLDQWQGWVRGHTWLQLVLMLSPLLLLDSPRYVILNVAFAIWDTFAGVPRRGLRDFSPSVTVLLPGMNEADGITRTIESLLGSYPFLEIIVIDDGSTDGMSEVVRPYAERGLVKLLTRPQRSGKPSALNLGLYHATGEIVASIDADCSVEPDTIWELIQPFRDPAVGAAGGALRVRNKNATWCTRMQAYDYLDTVIQGRRTMSRMDMLPIASGAHSAFRRNILEQVGGYDVHPADDADLTLKIRKAGWKVLFAPYAVCHTDVPETWLRMFHQRRRWSRAQVTLLVRKHSDLGTLRHRRFSLGNFLVAVDAWVFELELLILFWVWVAWLLITWPANMGNILLFTFVAYTAINAVQAAVILFYSDRRREDSRTCVAVPFYLPYRIWLRAGQLIAMIEELFGRASYDDPFIPPKVRPLARRW